MKPATERRRKKSKNHTFTHTRALTQIERQTHHNLNLCDDVVVLWRRASNATIYTHRRKKLRSAKERDRLLGSGDFFFSFCVFIVASCIGIVHSKCLFEAIVTIKQNPYYTLKMRSENRLFHVRRQCWWLRLISLFLLHTHTLVHAERRVFTWLRPYQRADNTQSNPSIVECLCLCVYLFLGNRSAIFDWYKR